MQRIGNPVPLFLDARGQLLDGGYIYVGEANADPEVAPIDVFSDPELTIPLAQPIRTVGGFAVDGVTPVFMFIAEEDYSQRVKDSTGSLVTYSPSVYTNADTFQTASDVLNALVANGTPTGFGLSLLLLANAGALEAVLGGLGFLQLIGGTITGEITRQGAGVLPHWDDPAMVSGKMFITDSGDPDPTTAPGDFWFVRA